MKIDLKVNIIVNFKTNKTDSGDNLELELEDNIIVVITVDSIVNLKVELDVNSIVNIKSCLLVKSIVNIWFT